MEENVIGYGLHIVKRLIENIVVAHKKVARKKPISK